MTAKSGIMFDLWLVFSAREVRAKVPSIRTVEMPAPTAASVNATSTASQVINKSADNRLKTPERATIANKLRVRTTERAVAASMLKSAMLMKVSILHLLPCYIGLFNEAFL